MFVDAWRIRIASGGKPTSEKRKSDRSTEVECRQAQQALQESEERFSKAFHSNPTAMAITEINGAFVDVNDSFQELIGFKKDEVIGKHGTVLGFFPYLSEQEHIIEQLQKRGRVSNYEMTFRHKSGKLVRVIFSLEKISIKEKTHLLGTAIDITDRKKAEDALKESEEKYRTLVENPNSIVMTTDKDLNITFMNKFGLEFFGYKEDEILGKNVIGTTIPNEDDEGRDLASMARGIANNPGKYKTNVHKNMRKSGELVWVSWTNSIRLDEKGNPIEILAIGNDISVLKQAEDALRLSEEKFSTAFNTSPTAITITRLSDGKIIEGNESSYRLFGYRPDEVIGKTTMELDIWADPNDRFKLAKELASNGLVEDMELVLKKKDGSEFPVNLSAALIEFSGEKCFLSSFIDITERRKSEDALKRSNEELRQFAYVASHDLQEPLRMVSSYIGLLDRKYGKSLNKEAKEYMDFALQGSERMRELIEDLLEYSRIDTKGKPFSPTDMNDVVQKTLMTLRTAIDESKAAIEADRLPMIMADDGQMAQLMQNLIGNAIKFKGEERPVIHIGASSGRYAWTFSVKDNGIGIASEHHQKVFEVFTRLHSTERYPGTGIGLSISKKIIERHGGRIWVESDGEGRGCTFFFTIPKR